MVGGDVVVAWVDKQTLQGYAVDYFLDAKSQCSGGRGSCPDTRIQVRISALNVLLFLITRSPIVALASCWNVARYRRFTLNFLPGRIATFAGEHEFYSIVERGAGGRI